mgnify:CR=1 FL=1
MILCCFDIPVTEDYILAGKTKKTEEQQEMRSLEDNFSVLEELIEQLEAEDISLEAAFTAYSRGMQVLKQCNEQIDRVEKQVMKLNEEGDLEPLDPQ